MALSFGQQVGATDPYLSPDDLKRRRSLAELLMAQGNSGRPITHWMQGVDNALGSFLGAMLDKKDREDARAATTSATASANAGLAGLFGGSASSSPASSDAAVTAPTTPPDQVKSVIDANVPEEMRPFAYQLASKESSFDPSAVSPTGATGLFQFTRGTGAQYGLVGEGGDRRADPVANTQAFVRLTNDNRDRLRAGLGREPTFGELALAHQQGAGGALRLLSGQSVDPTNLRVNGVAPGTDPRAAASKIMRYYNFGPRADAGNGVQVAALGDTANDASPPVPPPASLPTFAALGQGTGGVMGGLGGAGAALAPAAPDNPPLPPQRPPELALPAAAAEPATTASALPRSIFVPSSMQPNMPEQAADRAAVLDVARSAQPFNVFAPRQPAALASPAGPAGSTAPPPVNAGSQVTSAPAASGPTQSAAPSAPASQAAPAAGQDGARIQTLSTIISNPYTPPGQRAVAQAALTELLKRNLDPTGQAIQREQLAAAQNNNALAPIERRIKEANATKAERDLLGEGATALTAEEMRAFNIAEGQAAYKTRDGKIVFGPAAARTNVNIDQKQETEFGKEAGKKQAERFNAMVQGGQEAQVMIGNLSAIRDLGSRINTGKQAEVLNSLGPYAEALGLKIDGLGEMQAYNAIITRLAPQMRVPGSGATSDFEMRKFLEALPGLGKTPEGNEIIAQTFEALQQHRIAAADIASRALAGEIKPADAEKEIRALPDPMTLWKKGNSGAAPAPSSAPKVRRYNPATGKIE